MGKMSSGLIPFLSEALASAMYDNLYYEDKSKIVCCLDLPHKKRKLDDKSQKILKDYENKKGRSYKGLEDYRKAKQRFEQAIKRSIFIEFLSKKHKWRFRLRTKKEVKDLRKFKNKRYARHMHCDEEFIYHSDASSGYGSGTDYSPAKIQKIDNDEYQTQSEKEIGYPLKSITPDEILNDRFSNNDDPVIIHCNKNENKILPDTVDHDSWQISPLEDQDCLCLFQMEAAILDIFGSEEYTNADFSDLMDNLPIIENELFADTLLKSICFQDESQTVNVQGLSVDLFNDSYKHCVVSEFYENKSNEELCILKKDEHCKYHLHSDEDLGFSSFDLSAYESGTDCSATKIPKVYKEQSEDEIKPLFKTFAQDHIILNDRFSKNDDSVVVHFNDNGNKSISKILPNSFHLSYWNFPVHENRKYRSTFQKDAVVLDVLKSDQSESANFFELMDNLPEIGNELLADMLFKNICSRNEAPTLYIEDSSFGEVFRIAHENCEISDFRKRKKVKDNNDIFANKKIFTKIFSVNPKKLMICA